MYNSTRMLKMALKDKEQQLTELQARLAALQREYDSIKDSKLVRIMHNITRKKSVHNEDPIITETTVAPAPVYRVSAESFADMLKAYDVISFDAFDTLVLQNIRTHNDVFDIVSLKSGFESFSDLRIRREQTVSQNYAALEKEYDINHIYDCLSQWLSMDRTTVMNTEIATEKALSTANPYMKQVFDLLIEAGKDIIITADTYLPSNVVERIISDCGYLGYKRLFVSNEVGCSKRAGNMYDHINSIYDGKNIISVGDEYINDVVNAQSHGWQAVCYFPCRDISSYRFSGTSSPVGDIWSGIVTNKVFSAPDDFSSGYKHGYSYGGILTVGYCKWLEKFALQNKADKILFLARDAQIYSEIFEKHINTVPHRYMLASRFAMWQIVFDIHTEEYIRFFFYNRALASNTKIADAFVETGLDFLVDKLETECVNGDEILTLSNYDAVRKFIYDNQTVISDSFAPARQAARQYFTRCFGTAKRIVLSDVGWSGQILLHVRHFVRDIMKRPDIEIIGAFMATNVRKDINNYVNSGILTSYLYNYGQNRDMNVLMENNIGNTSLMCLEAMYSSSSPTLMGYTLTDEGESDFIFGQETANTHVIESVQQGIRDFVADWFETMDKLALNLTITSADAFAPYETVAFDWQHLSDVFGDFAEYTDSLPRFGKSRMYTTISEIMKQRGLIKL